VASILTMYINKPTGRNKPTVNSRPEKNKADHFRIPTKVNSQPGKNPTRGKYLLGNILLTNKKPTTQFTDQQKTDRPLA
jgi:hypothetical protein